MKHIPYYLLLLLFIGCESKTTRTEHAITTQDTYNKIAVDSLIYSKKKKVNKTTIIPLFDNFKPVNPILKVSYKEFKHLTLVAKIEDSIPLLHESMIFERAPTNNIKIKYYSEHDLDKSIYYDSLEKAYKNNYYFLHGKYYEDSKETDDLIFRVFDDYRNLSLLSIWNNLGDSVQFHGFANNYFRPYFDYTGPILNDVFSLKDGQFLIHGCYAGGDGGYSWGNNWILLLDRKKNVRLITEGSIYRQEGDFFDIIQKIELDSSLTFFRLSESKRIIDSNSVNGQYYDSLIAINKIYIF